MFIMGPCMDISCRTVTVLLILAVLLPSKVSSRLWWNSKGQEDRAPSRSVEEQPQVDYASLLERLWEYQPELPKAVLDQAIGFQGDRTRLERAVWKLIRGEPVSIALLGGSISIRGWTQPDEAYIRQVHKWLESVFVPGCKEGALAGAHDRHHTARSSARSSARRARVLADLHELMGAHTYEVEVLQESASGVQEGPGSSSSSSSSNDGAQRQRPVIVGDRGGGSSSGGGSVDVGAEQADVAAAGETSAPRRRVMRSRRRDEDEEEAEEAEDKEEEKEQQEEEAAAKSEEGSRASAPKRKGPPVLDPWGHEVRLPFHATTDPHYVETGHLCRGSRISLTSMAVPAAGPGYAERCVLQHLPPDVDLVLLDFGVNDYQATNDLSHPERHALERIMRTVLAASHHPALVMFEAYSWEHAQGTFIGKNARGAYLGEDKHLLLAQYYGNVQSLSVRAALYQLMAATHKTSNRMIYLGGPDLLHVTVFGHVWYADIIINYLRQVATDVINRHLAAQAMRGSAAAAAAAANIGPAEAGTGEEVEVVGSDTCIALQEGYTAPTLAPAPPPPPTKKGKEVVVQPEPLEVAPPSGLALCHVAGHSGSQYPTFCSPGPLKPPFFVGNEAEVAGVCAIGSDFVAVVEEHEGWDWVDEGTATVHKYGFVSETVGSRLRIKLDLSQHQADLSNKKSFELHTNSPSVVGGASTGRFVTRDVLAWLIYLQSWHLLGMARISCEGGCSCEPQVINGMVKDAHIRATTPDLFFFSIKPGQLGSGDCIVQVEVLPESSSPDQGHRFKVVGITTSTHDVWHLNDIVHRGNEHFAEDLAGGGN